MEDARRSLADVGARVVDDYLARARADEADGLYENAVAAINRIDSLRGRTGQVGVPLAVPDDYADFRRGHGRRRRRFPLPAGRGPGGSGELARRPPDIRTDGSPIL